MWSNSNQQSLNNICTVNHQPGEYSQSETETNIRVRHLPSNMNYRVDDMMTDTHGKVLKSFCQKQKKILKKHEQQGMLYFSKFSRKG